MASERPCTRTMPSVTEITVPWLRMSALAARPTSRLLIRSEFSAGLSSVSLVLLGRGRPSGRQRNFHWFQAGLDGTVEHLVADHHADSADEGWIFLHGHVQLAAEPPLERHADFAQGRSGDGEGAVDDGVR